MFSAASLNLALPHLDQFHAHLLNKSIYLFKKNLLQTLKLLNNLQHVSITFQNIPREIK